MSRATPESDPVLARRAAEDLVRALSDVASRGGNAEGWEEALRLYAAVAGRDSAGLRMYGDFHRHRSERVGTEAGRIGRGPAAPEALELAVAEADRAIGFVREALTHDLGRAVRAEELLKLGMTRVRRAASSWRLALLRDHDESFDAFAWELAEVDEALGECRAAVATAKRGTPRRAARLGLARSLILRAELGLRAHSLGLAHGVHDFGFLAALNEADQALRFPADDLEPLVTEVRGRAERVRAEWAKV